MAAGPALQNEMFQVDWQGVSSTNLDSVAYSPDFARLWIRFSPEHKGGGRGRVTTYVFHSVPESVYRGLMGAGSKGQYFHRHVKGQFGYTRVS